MEPTEIVENQETVKCSKYKTMKTRLINVLQSKNFCCVCFDTGNTLISLNKTIILEHWESSYSESVKFILQAVLGAQFHLHSNHICTSCNESMIGSYMFILDTKATSRIMDNLIDQLYERINQCGSLETTYNDNYINTIIILDDPIHNEKIQESEMKKLRYGCDEKRKCIYYCDYCYRGFKSKQRMVKHIQRYHIESNELEPTTQRTPIHCTECKSNNCIHKDYVLSYLKQRAFGHKIIKCMHCDFKCYCKSALLIHASKKHLKTLKVMCEICSMQFHSNLDLKNHIMHYHTEMFACKYCDHNFRTKSNMEKHEEECKVIVRQFKCKKCPCSFDVRSKLTSHLSKKHSQQYKCDSCTKVLISATLLERHKLLFHAGHRQVPKHRKFDCCYCNKQFVSTIDRAQHIAEEHNSNDLPTCSLCDLTFDTMKLYNRHKLSAKHLRRSNPNFKYNFQCQQCDFSTSQSQALEQHVNRFHLKILPYECNICTKKFAGPIKLREHLKTHVKNKKDFHCDICKKYFSCSNTLMKHRRIHTGECPYLCNICGLAFSNSTLRNNHEIKHGGKNVHCPICDSKFYAAGNLRAHIKKVHWKSTEPFDINKVEGIGKELLELFRDKRMIVID